MRDRIELHQQQHLVLSGLLVTPYTLYAGLRVPGYHDAAGAQGFRVELFESGPLDRELAPADVRLLDWPGAVGRLDARE